MPGKRTVLDLLEQGHDHEEVGHRLGISPGLVHLVATGIPADGGDSVTGERLERPGYAGAGGGRLVHPRAHNPTSRSDVLDWIRQRASADAPLRAAGTADGT